MIINPDFCFYTPLPITCSWLWEIIEIGGIFAIIFWLVKERGERAPVDVTFGYQPKNINTL